MTLDEARDYFGNYAKLALALKINRSAITQWDGEIPEARQLEIHRLTKGALKADSKILAKYREILRAA
jgi:hypothetical protein